MKFEENFTVNLTKIKPFCGVYFIYTDKEVLYIGQSVNVLQRIEEHKRNLLERCNIKKYNVSFLRCGRGKLLRLERAMLNKYLPFFNYDPITRRKKREQGLLHYKTFGDALYSRVPK